jgi:hypothetical protein
MMVGRFTIGAFGGLLAAGALIGLVGPVSAETLVEHSAESRMQLDLHVPDAALKTFLPAGWEPNVATAGAAKDANIRVIFIDRIDVTAPDGAALATNQLVYLAVPIKQTGTNVVGQMIIAGLTSDPKDAPGAFGVYLPATTHRMQRSSVAATGQPTQTEEHWEFAAATGERLELQMKYERGVARRSSSETKFFSPGNPNVYQIFKIEQGLDIMRNATIEVRDRVKEFQLKGSGGKIGALFDGTERVLSIDALPWYTRAISQP